MPYRLLAVGEIRQFRTSSHRTGLLAALVGLALLWQLGCSKRPTLPKTYPVRGRVVFQGGEAVPGGSIVFQPESNDARFSVECAIDPDGTFTLYSFKPGIRVSGAPAGSYRVIVTSPRDKQRGHLFPAITFSDSYTVKPNDNEFTLTVPKQPR